MMGMLLLAVYVALVLKRFYPRLGKILSGWGLLILGLILLALPLPQFFIEEQDFVNNALLFSFTQMFMLATLSSNWNLTGGFTGYIDFGHAVFFGLGAYGTGIMMSKLGWPLIPGLIVGALARLCTFRLRNIRYQQDEKRMNAAI